MDIAKTISTFSKGSSGGLSISGFLNHDKSSDYENFLERQASAGYLKQYMQQVDLNGIVSYFYEYLFSDLVVDISGYTMAFMIPPHLTYYASINEEYNTSTSNSFVNETTKIIPVMAVNFTPPQVSTNMTTISGGSGNQQIASKLQISDSMSVSYLETADLDIYTLHKTWQDYIYEIMDGSYGTSVSKDFYDDRIIDYPTSMYFVKWLPDMDRINYIGKAIGIVPRDLPSSELLGNRASNDLTTLTFTYSVADYREITYRQNITSSWLYDELALLLKGYEPPTGVGSILGNKLKSTISKGATSLMNKFS